MTPDELELLKRVHRAMDMLFGMLIVATRMPLTDAEHKRLEPFFPSQCGEPWDAMVALHGVIAVADGHPEGK